MFLEISELCALALVLQTVAIQNDESECASYSMITAHVSIIFYATFERWASEGEEDVNEKN